ncbi:MAG: arylamine N-acetyltransferase family protein [Acidimicrobiales bacterium]
MTGVIDVDQYLARIGFDGAIDHDLATLSALQRAHLSTIPFENLDVVAGRPVRTDLGWSIPKIVHERRGGWCFEVNGAFSGLLDALGFDVARLGAAVLLDGPTEVIDHLTIEVMLDRPYLVDVGFGDSFIVPLELNRRGPQNGGSGTFEFIDSSQGLTLTHLDDAGVPVPQFRFRRVNRTLAEFEPASKMLRSDPELHWSQKPFATRLVDGGPDRVTLLRDRLKLTTDGATEEIPVAAGDWDDVLFSWFGVRCPEAAG